MLLLRIVLFDEVYASSHAVAKETVEVCQHFFPFSEIVDEMPSELRKNFITGLINWLQS